MAIKDRLFLSSYKDFTSFRIWCFQYNPLLLSSFINPFMSELEWIQCKEGFYESHKKEIEDSHTYSSTTQMLEKHYLSNGLELPSFIELSREVKKHNDEYKKIFNKLSWLESFEIPIAEFNQKQIKYLLWHCPFHFVRQFIENKYGYTTRWYHKISFKS